jgi:hypothetical protein
VFGVPVSAPVVVLKLIPGGVALMLKLAIAPPVELEVKPVAAVFTVRVSDDEDKVNAGAVKRDVITRLLVPLELTATNVPTPLTVPYVTDCQLLSAAALRAVQVIASGLVITRLAIVPEVVSLTATNRPSPYVTAFQVFVLFSAAVRAVQVSPLFMLVITAPLVPTATNVPTPLTVPYVTERQLLSAAAVRAAQVIPLVLVITRSAIVPEVLSLTATNTPLPYVTERQLLFAAAVRAAQVIPSVLVITRSAIVPLVLSLTATNTPLPYVTERHLFSPPIAVRGVQVFPSGLVNTLLVGWVSSTTTNWLLP